MMAPKYIGAGIPAVIEMNLLLHRANKRMSQVRWGPSGLKEIYDISWGLG